MHPSERLPPNYRYPERDVVARDLGAGRDSSNQRIGTTPEESEYYAGSPPVAPLSNASAHYSGSENHQFANSKPSIGKRMFRAVVRFFFAVLIGVGVTLAWQSYGDEAKEMIRTRAPSLGWLLPVTTMESPMMATTLPELMQQLKPMSLDLAIVRRSLEQLAAKQDQLAAKQEQMAQNVATLQEVEQDISQKISSLPSSQAVHIPPRKSLSPVEQPLR